MAKPKAGASPLVCFKGFSASLQCRDFQFEVGKTYKHKGRLVLCLSGFHACEQPLDVLAYYPLADGNRYALVELRGVTKAKKQDSKRVGRSITIIRELTMRELIEAQVEVIAKAKGAEIASGDFSKAASSGNSSKAASSGDYSQAASSGNSSQAASSGNSSKAASSGDSSKAASSGDFSKAASSGDSSKAASSGDY
ncbi:MAG: DUF7666 domain-containing protein, partial [Pseudomonas sp.]